MSDETNDLGGRDFKPVADAVGKLREALDGLTVAEQLATLAQVAGYVMMAAEHRAGKEAGDLARKTFATMLRNVCIQWRREFNRANPD